MKNFESVQNYSDQKWIYECVLCRSRFLRQLATLLWHAMLRILQHPLVNFTFYKKNSVGGTTIKMYQYNLIHTTTIQSMINVQLIQQRLAIGMDKSGQFQ